MSLHNGNVTEWPNQNMNYMAPPAYAPASDGLNRPDPRYSFIIENQKHIEQIKRYFFPFNQEQCFFTEQNGNYIYTESRNGYHS